MTLEHLRSKLSAIEPDDSIYEGIGPSEIPLLEQLLKDKEAWMASRAIFALSRVPDIRAVEILSRTVDDPRQEVRVALAASVSNLKPKDYKNILLKLLNDTELGVRKFAIKTVSGVHDEMIHEKLRDIETQDPLPSMRKLAKDKLREFE